MATLKSVQETNRTATPVITPLMPIDYKGKERISWFDLNTTTTPVTTSDTINLCLIPSGARILGGRVTFGAMGASATLAIGTAASSTRYSAAIDVSAIGAADVANTQALNIGDILTADTVIVGTPAGANFAAAKDLKGYIKWVLE